MLVNVTRPGGEWLAYRCAPAITWVKDTDQILLVDAEREQFWLIQGVEAAIWDFLALAYPYEKIVRFLSLIQSISTDEAEETLQLALCSWQRAGIVQLEEESKRGQSGHQCRL